MGEAERATIRLRHHTRTSSKERILAEGRIIARDQNKVFVERADRPPLSARQAEAKYLLKRGRGNAYIEFDAMSDEVYEQTNHLTGAAEFFLRGTVDLSTRYPQGCDNS
jgi:ADP-ribosyltransferase of polymorphic toxin system